ncbi:MAG: hypothetical protein AAB656_00700 [Patescibacteria group bacterium]
MSAEWCYPSEKKLDRLAELVGSREIFYDVDAICEDTLKPVLAAVNSDFAVDIKRCEVQGFDSISRLLLELRPDLGLSFEELLKQEWKYWTNPDILSQAEPVLGIQFFMFMFDCAGFKQHMVTSRNPELRGCTMALADRYPYIRSITIRNEAERNVPGDIFKSTVVKNNFLVEDYLPNIRRVIEANKHAKALWLSWPGDAGKYRNGRVTEVRGDDGIQNMWRAWEKIICL